MTTHDIGIIIWQLRQQRGLSQFDLAATAEVSRLTVWSIEAGKTNPRLETLNKLAQALGTQLSVLFEPE